MTPDPRTAPDRLRAFFAEHDVVDPEAAYAELAEHSDLLVDVLRCLGVLGQPYWKCNACGESAYSREGLRHKAHYTGNVRVMRCFGPGSRS